MNADKNKRLKWLTEGSSSVQEIKTNKNSNHGRMTRSHGFDETDLVSSRGHASLAAEPQGHRASWLTMEFYNWFKLKASARHMTLVAAAYCG